MPKRRGHGDGALYKLESRGLWRGVIDAGYDAEGKRVQKYVHAKSQRECKARLDELRREIAQYGAPLDKKVTVTDWSDRWLATVQRDVDPKTYSGYAGIVTNWIRPTIGRKRVATLKPSDVRAVLSAILDAGRSTSRARQAHVVMSLMLDAARVERLCAKNVAADVKKIALKQADRESIPTPQALAILRAAAEMPNSAGSRWWFKLLAGPRQGEVTGATIDDLHLDDGYYLLQWKLEELVREHGCDGTCGYKRGANCPQARWRVPDGFENRHLEGRFHLTRPKSVKGQRVVPLIPQLGEAIRRHLDATADIPNPHRLIWRNPDGSPITARQDAQEWRDLLVTAGVITPAESVPGGTRLTGHCARHTTVTILASLGVDMQIIGEIVGHSSQQVTEIYRHAHATEKRAAMEALGGVWGEALALPGSD